MASSPIRWWCTEANNLLAAAAAAVALPGSTASSFNRSATIRRFDERMTLTPM